MVEVTQTMFRRILIYALGAVFLTAGGVRAQTPLSPVHLRARRTGGGDVEFSWIRRSRLAADSWELAEVPLGEEIESYAVDILSGSATIRTLAAGASSALYPADQELADFGAPQSALSVRIAQISAAVGRGRPLAATLPIH